MKPLFLLLPTLGCALGPHIIHPAAPDPLVGTWRLIAQQTMVQTGKKLPSETLVLGSSQQFRLFYKRRVIAQGFYRTGSDSTCGKHGLMQLILESATYKADVLAGTYALRGDTLFLDHTFGGCVPDAGSQTYLRQF